MRILIDATSLLLRSAGIKTYTYHWIQHLWQQAGNEQILTFPRIDKLRPLNHERSILSPRQTYPQLALLYAANLFPAFRLLRLDDGRRRCFSCLQPDPESSGRNTRLTATIHDMTCRLMPELHTPDNVRADESFAETCAAPRRSPDRGLGKHPRRCDSCCWAWLRSASRSSTPEFPTSISARSPGPIERPYVLSLGTIEPRKNIDTLLDAWQGFRLRNDFDLLIAGATGWASEKDYGAPDIPAAPACAISATCLRTNCPVSPRARRLSFTRRCMKALVFRSHRPWLRACR